MELETQCPKCKENVFGDASDLNIDRVATCAACGYSAKFGDFLTPDTRDRILEAAKNMLAKSFSNIPGFKKI